MRRFKVGRLHVTFAKEWETGFYERAWILLALWRCAIGVGGRLRGANPFVELYLLLAMIEVYYDRTGEWDDDNGAP